MSVQNNLRMHKLVFFVQVCVDTQCYQMMMMMVMVR